MINASRGLRQGHPIRYKVLSLGLIRYPDDVGSILVFALLSRIWSVSHLPLYLYSRNFWYLVLQFFGLNWILHFSLIEIIMELFYYTFFKGKLMFYVIMCLGYLVRKKLYRIFRDFLGSGERFIILLIIVIFELLFIIKLKLYSTMVITSNWDDFLYFCGGDWTMIWGFIRSI